MFSESGIQLSLFEEEHEPESSHENLKNVVWSYSRRSTLEQCARRYYYEYYGSNKKTAKEESNKKELHSLKQLQNRYERTGSILHLVISQYFRKAQNGESWTISRLESWARDIFQKDIVYSEAGHNKDDLPTGPFPPVSLQEFYYTIPNAKDLCQGSLEQMLQSLRSFYSGKEFTYFRDNGVKGNALVEYPFKLKNFPCRIDGKLDLAFQHNNVGTIVDWKSGGNDGGGEDSLQLAAYALWGVDYFSSSPDLIKIFKAHLRDSNVVEFNIDTRFINVARARIIQDAERMADINSYGETAMADAFTPCGHKSVCLLCSFRNACPEGRNI
jgi:hypothetical protein